MKISEPKKKPLVEIERRSERRELYEKLDTLEVGEMIEISCDETEYKSVIAGLQHFRTYHSESRQYTLRTLSKGKQYTVGIWRIK